MAKLNTATVIILLFIYGCADTHSVKVSGTDSNVRLEPESTVYIALSTDGQYGEHHYTGSAYMVSQTIQAELMVTLNRAVIAQKPETYKSALSSAALNEFEYLVYPTILHWEDRATEWSSKPDKVKVKIAVVDVKTQTIIKSGIIEGKSGIATFGGDKPQDLLFKPTKQFFANMF
ncbi:DUF4823 domain-containing protein [Flocculibacter collagenilyticus]|uniref:DUF4823 domain-containing protein n=1 Tax=Flocculibacter collagenilyticus TaxID=2744479 RepID=UPI0018F7173D|nr:DUF4823 domain-containing protein [Flocculibacter collagenilyticus]